MGLLDFIFRKRTKIEDDFFGTMLFMGNKKEPQKSCFECRRHFAPTDKTIEIGIVGDESGVTQLQVDFFKNIELNYTTIIISIKPLIENEFRNWKEGFKISNFQKEFEAVYLELPRCENKPVVWEIAFESSHDKNHTFTLTMSDLEAKKIHIDG